MRRPRNGRVAPERLDQLIDEALVPPAVVEDRAPGPALSRLALFAAAYASKAWSNAPHASSALPSAKPRLALSGGTCARVGERLFQSAIIGIVRS